ncbi:hypothetical protein SPOG_01714 [Schizosaccharomyces cryophilus OY26]|uniref:Uncharacterized protein n=1 Tax=Schizosaccharomyces cryophilus (strain OY26 / ATCC MYA-4695 / CBS 11777 / NBRC 106824 / NRRL Y48691) TaxID=653667 RepID=S9VXT6_SCHCR|nr:uncharacterized protein SPOG_01714 [Schizosaccharomyces cryophilus OY26]EPY52388.1 hypothetical protein SPOG_01714 [Schizosaccharomyces cryophilus OY26]
MHSSQSNSFKRLQQESKKHQLKVKKLRHPEEKKKLCKLLVFYGSKKKSARALRRASKPEFQYLPRRTILKMEEQLLTETIKARALTVMIFCLISGQVLTNLF